MSDKVVVIKELSIGGTNEGITKTGGIKAEKQVVSGSMTISGWEDYVPSGWPKPAPKPENGGDQGNPRDGGTGVSGIRNRREYDLSTSFGIKHLSDPHNPRDGGGWVIKAEKQIDINDGSGWVIEDPTDTISGDDQYDAAVEYSGIRWGGGEGAKKPVTGDINIPKHGPSIIGGGSDYISGGEGLNHEWYIDGDFYISQEDWFGGSGVSKPVTGDVRCDKILFGDIVYFGGIIKTGSRSGDWGTRCSTEHGGIILKVSGWEDYVLTGWPKPAPKPENDNDHYDARCATEHGGKRYTGRSTEWLDGTGWGRTSEDINDPTDLGPITTDPTETIEGDYGFSGGDHDYVPSGWPKPEPEPTPAPFSGDWGFSGVWDKQDPTSWIVGHTCTFRSGDRKGI